MSVPNFAGLLNHIIISNYIFIFVSMKQILKLAIPNILTNLSVPLLSSVDTAVVGHLDKISYLGAIAIGSMIFNFIYWGFGFLRMGTTGMTAIGFGRKDNSETSSIAGRAMLIAVLAGLTLILLRTPINDISFSLINASADVEKYASQYFYIRIFAAPATLAIYVFHGWFLGMQNSKYPMILLITVNLLNIFYNLMFIYHFGMKSDGVAWGTVAAQYSGLLIAVVLFAKKYYSQLSYVKIDKILHVGELKRFFKINGDIFLRTLALIFTLSFFTAESARFGDNILAANTILLQLWIFLSYAVDGFAFAGESLVGKYHGAKNYDGVKQIVKLLFYFGVGIAVIFTAIYLLFEEPILRLFTNDTVVVELAMTYFLWTALTPIVNSISFLWDGIYIGATATSIMRNTMVISALLIFLPAYYLFRESMGNEALWLAMVLFMVTRAIGLTLKAKKYIFNSV